MATTLKGASSEDWSTFDVLFGLTGDLLPVVSDPSVKISPNSKMATVGKTPSHVNRQGYAAGIADWTNYVASEEDIARWSSDPRLGICLQTRRVRALDIDVTDADQATAIQALLYQHLPAYTPRRFRKDSSKFLVLVDLPGDYSKRSFKTEHGIVEFLATGQQCIVAGTHTGGARYEWESLDQIPSISPEQFETLWSALADQYAVEAPSEERTSKKEVLASALTLDPTARFLLENDWVLSSERDGRLHIRCPFEHEHTSPSSESATTYFPANTGGYALGHFDCKHAHCAHRSDQDFKDGLGFVDIDFTDLTEVAPPEEPSTPGRYPLVHASEYSVRQTNGYHIKGLVPCGELVMVFGPSQSGKSFMALSLGMAIATGTPWREHRVHQGRVVYIIAEGRGGFIDRIKAHAEYFDVDLNAVDLYVIPATPNFLQSKDVKDLIAAIKPYKPAVIIIDTWAQVTAGGDENSGEDMGKALGHCKAMHYATGATPIIIHHSGKDSSKGARGWSGVHGAADAILDINRSDDDRVMSVVKMKDGSEGKEYGFRLQTVRLGEDEDGDDITSCVVVEHTVTLREIVIGKNERNMLRIVADLAGLTGINPDINTVIDTYVEEIPFDPATEGRDRRKEQALKVYKNCLRKKAFVEDEGRVKIVNKGDQE